MTTKSIQRVRAAHLPRLGNIETEELAEEIKMDWTRMLAPALLRGMFPGSLASFVTTNIFDQADYELQQARSKNNPPKSILVEIAGGNDSGKTVLERQLKVATREHYLDLPEDRDYIIQTKGELIYSGGWDPAIERLDARGIKRGKHERFTPKGTLAATEDVYQQGQEGLARALFVILVSPLNFPEAGKSESDSRVHAMSAFQRLNAEAENYHTRLIQMVGGYYVTEVLGRMRDLSQKASVGEAQVILASSGMDIPCSEAEKQEMTAGALHTNAVFLEDESVLRLNNPPSEVSDLVTELRYESTKLDMKKIQRELWKIATHRLPELVPEAEEGMLSKLNKIMRRTKLMLRDLPTLAAANDMLAKAKESYVAFNNSWPILTPEGSIETDSEGHPKLRNEPDPIPREWLVRHQKR